MLFCIATANASTTTFTDALNLNHEQSILLGRQGIFSGGTATNLERIVRVSGNVKATQTITFTPAVPTSTGIADELELWNQRDEGLAPNVINDLINDAIADVYENAPVPVVSDSITFDRNDPIIDVDTDILLATVADGENWEVVTGVEWRPLTSDTDITYVWQKVPRADIAVDRDARTISLLNRAPLYCDGNEVRVRGANVSGSLSTDDSTTQVNAEWLALQVSANALSIRLEKAYDRKDLDITRASLQQRADMVRPRTVLRLPGAYWRLT
jgi:hypothetical protein